MTTYYPPVAHPFQSERFRFTLGNTSRYTERHKRQRIYVRGRLAALITYLNSAERGLLLGYMEIAGRVEDWDALCAHLHLSASVAGLPDSYYPIRDRAELLRIRETLA